MMADEAGPRSHGSASVRELKPRFNRAGIWQEVSPPSCLEGFRGWTRTGPEGHGNPGLELVRTARIRRLAGPEYLCPTGVDGIRAGVEAFPAGLAPRPLFGRRPLNQDLKDGCAYGHDLAVRELLGAGRDGACLAGEGSPCFGLEVRFANVSPPTWNGWQTGNVHLKPTDDLWPRADARPTCCRHPVMVFTSGTRTFGFDALEPIH